MKKPITIVVGLVIAVVAIFGTMEYTSRPQFCTTCHQIEPAVASWQQSPHAEDADCLACHADSGLVNKVARKVSSVKEMYVHLAERPNPEDLQGEVPNTRCTKCHEEDLEEMDELLKPVHAHEDVECASCHRDTAHGQEEKVKLELVQSDKCVACHTDEAQIAKLSKPLPPAAAGGQG